MAAHRIGELLDPKVGCSKMLQESWTSIGGFDDDLATLDDQLRGVAMQFRQMEVDLLTLQAVLSEEIRNFARYHHPHRELFGVAGGDFTEQVGIV